MASRFARQARSIVRGLAVRWPVWVIVAFACWMIWPAPIGSMPMSQDHTVHLARSWMYAANLAKGHITGWSSYWYFGFPIGELYPPFGDIAVTLVRALTFGRMEWATCYAFVFSAAYVAQGLVLLRVSRATGLGPVPALVAAALLYLDPGILREGGWAYTVHYGVWLQPLAVSLIWWAFAELALRLRAEEPPAPTKLILPAVLLGIAFVTHPIAIPMISVGALMFMLFMGFRAGPAAGRTVLYTGIALAIAGCLAAWWVLPLYSNRHWMATYGTLYSGLGTLLQRLTVGQWSKHMLPAIGHAITLGLIWCWFRGNRFAKFMATYAVLLWAMSTSDFFFRFRLDWLSENFRHLQYQRFIICAKPGLYVAAGAVIVGLARVASDLWRRRASDRRSGITMGMGWSLAAIMLALLVHAGYTARKDHHLGDLRVQRLRSDPKFDKHLKRFTDWAAQQWSEREGFWRFAFKSKRHTHVYVDAPVYTGAPSYKIGFTPGEVFVHKLESEQGAVLDRLRVRYVVGVGGGRKNKQVQRFGRIKVFERPVTEEVARLVGGGTLEVLLDDPDDEGVIVRVTGATEGARLEFNISGFPRWQLERDGEEVEWYEAPVTGDGEVATQAERRAGLWRAGRGNFPPPTDPILLACDAEDGTYVLRYRHWLAADVLGWTATLLGLVGLVALRFPRAQSVLSAVERLLRPRVLAGALVAMFLVLAVRYTSGFVSESHLASGWLRIGRADDVEGMRNGPIKIERLIGPAILVDAELDEPATITLSDIDTGSGEIHGWYAIDDGHLKGGRIDYTLVVEGRASGGDGEWTKLSSTPIRLRSGKQSLDVSFEGLAESEKVDLRVTVEGKRGTLPRMGLDFELQ